MSNFSSWVGFAGVFQNTHFSLQPGKHTVLPEDVAIDSVRVFAHLMCSGCSGMSPPCHFYTAHNSFNLDAAHKLKQKDKESILVRTGSTIPGKSLYYRGPVWLHSVLHYCFPQGFLTSSTPVTQTLPFLGAMYVLLPSSLSSVFFLPWASARQPQAGE